jgi:hypothetical protein
MKRGKKELRSEILKEKKYILIRTRPRCGSQPRRE